MGHYGRMGVPFVCGYDFEKSWRKTLACTRDGCSTVNVKRVFSDKKFSESLLKRFCKKYEDREDAKSYCCNAYDIGIVGWVIKVKKNRIVNHKRVEVVEEHEYKTKPKRILKGGSLVELHKYIIDYDGRCYDPLEHC